MAATATLYGQAALALAKKQINLATDVLKLMLVKSTYTPNIDTHATTTDLGSNEVTGTAYTSGGATIANLSLTYDATNNKVVLDGDDVEWAESTITGARYGVINDTTASKLLGYIDFGQDESSSSGVFRVKWSADGIINLPLQ